MPRAPSHSALIPDMSLRPHARRALPCSAQVPALNIFETSYRRGKFDESRKLSNGKLMEFAHIYPMDAVFDTVADVPEDVSEVVRTCRGLVVCGLRYP